MRTTIRSSCLGEKKKIKSAYGIIKSLLIWTIIRMSMTILTSLATYRRMFESMLADLQAAEIHFLEFYDRR